MKGPMPADNEDRIIDLEMQAYEIAEDNDTYLHGNCHVFALALARLSGLSLGAFVDFNDDLERDCLVHAFVIDSAGGDKAIIDIRGWRSFTADDCVNEFPCGFPCFTTLSPDELAKLGGGVDAQSVSIETEVAAALPLAKRLYAIALEQRALEQFSAGSKVHSGVGITP
jgi:hypothetical protein